MRRHMALVRFVKKRVRKGDTHQIAIGKARKLFARVTRKEDLKDHSVRAEFYRAERFIKSVPLLAAAMASIDCAQLGTAGKAFVDFVGERSTAFIRYGTQDIAADHLMRPQTPKQKNPSRRPLSAAGNSF
jgi:hypothetical protein